MRELNTTIVATRIRMNERHPIRHFFTNRRIQDEYAMGKGNPSPIFIRTIDKFGELGVDKRKVETASSYKRAPWMIDAVKCLDESRLRDCHTCETMIKKRMRSQTTIFSAEQEAIIKVICISKGKGANVIATAFLSTMMAVEGTRWTKNSKTRRIRELLDQEKGRVKLMWIPSHSEITRNERADEAAKNAVEEDINGRELYPPQELIVHREKTPEHTGWQNDTKKLKRRDQVAVTRLRTGYSYRATHRNKMEGTSDPHPMAVQRNRGRTTKE
jgi:hypothetical protein